MRICVTIQHPAHVHFYRPIVDELRSAGHELAVFVREKEVTVDLLEAYDIEHQVLARLSEGVPSRFATTDVAATHLAYEYRLFRALRQFEPDVVTGIGGVAAAHVAPLVGARSVVFTDNDGVASNRVVAPFADVVCTPEWYDGDFGTAHRRYAGFHELSYLHPDRFEPSPDPLREAGVDPEERYFLLRFVGWGAHHDVGEHGLSLSAKEALVSFLDEHGSVYITSESPLPESFEPYRLPVPPHRIHDLLHYADLYAGDSGTMATEAALLGTPAVRSDSFAGQDDLSNFAQLARYGLVLSTDDEERALEHVRDLAAREDATEEWRRRRDRLLEDTVDVASYAVDVLEEEARQSRHRGSAAAAVLRGLSGLARQE